MEEVEELFEEYRRDGVLHHQGCPIPLRSGDDHQGGPIPLESGEDKSPSSANQNVNEKVLDESPTASFRNNNDSIVGTNRDLPSEIIVVLNASNNSNNIASVYEHEHDSENDFVLFSLAKKTAGAIDQSRVGAIDQSRVGSIDPSRASDRQQSTTDVKQTESNDLLGDVECLLNTVVGHESSGDTPSNQTSRDSPFNQISRDSPSVIPDCELRLDNILRDGASYSVDDTSSLTEGSTRDTDHCGVDEEFVNIMSLLSEDEFQRGISEEDELQRGTSTEEEGEPGTSLETRETEDASVSRTFAAPSSILALSQPPAVVAQLSSPCEVLTSQGAEEEEVDTGLCIQRIVSA